MVWRLRRPTCCGDENNSKRKRPRIIRTDLPQTQGLTAWNESFEHPLVFLGGCISVPDPLSAKIADSRRSGTASCYAFLRTLPRSQAVPQVITLRTHCDCLIRLLCHCSCDGENPEPYRGSAALYLQISLRRKLKVHII
jgi:hypothetical protein